MLFRNRLQSYGKIMDNLHEPPTFNPKEVKIDVS